MIIYWTQVCSSYWSVQNPLPHSFILLCWLNDWVWYSTSLKIAGWFWISRARGEGTSLRAGSGYPEQEAKRQHCLLMWGLDNAHEAGTNDDDEGESWCATDSADGDDDWKSVAIWIHSFKKTKNCQCLICINLELLSLNKRGGYLVIMVGGGGGRKVRQSAEHIIHTFAALPPLTF